MNHHSGVWPAVLGGVVSGICLFFWPKNPHSLLRLAPPIRKPEDGSHQASIATGRGDTGVTTLFDGSIVSKSDDVFDAIGTIDELSAALGIVISSFSPSSLTVVDDVNLIKKIQKQLTTVMAVIATPTLTEFRSIQVSEIEEMTNFVNTHMNIFDTQLPPLREFILPCGNETSTRLHLARAICRRAERSIVRIKNEVVDSRVAIQYLNRLSDLLFTLARWHANSDDERVPRRT